METAQILLIAVILLLTVNLLFVGVYIILVLKEVKAAINRANQFLDKVNSVADSLAEPVLGAGSAIAGFIEGLRAIANVKDIFRGLKSPDNDGDGEE